MFSRGYVRDEIKNGENFSPFLTLFYRYITIISIDFNSFFKPSGNASSVISTWISSNLANVCGLIFPIFELSNIIYVNFAFLRTILNISASTCEPHEKPFSGVNAAAEIIANSKLESAKYIEEREDAVDKLSFISVPPNKLTVTFFFLQSSVATARPLVNTLHGTSGISFAKYNAVEPASRKMDAPSSIKLAALLAIAIFSSVWIVVFFV